MSKAMLLLDMPASCRHCDFGYYSDGRTLLCGYRDMQGLEDSKPSWCPLKPLPEKQYGRHDDNNWENGWNACVDHILR